MAILEGKMISELPLVQSLLPTDIVPILRSSSNMAANANLFQGGGIEQVQSDWSEVDSSNVSYIRNKPTIPDAQVQSDWNIDDILNIAYIKNKPTIVDSYSKIEIDNKLNPILNDITSINGQIVELTNHVDSELTAVKNAINSKQDILVSESNIKSLSISSSNSNLTVEPIIGSGSINISTIPERPAGENAGIPGAFSFANDCNLCSYIELSASININVTLSDPVNMTFSERTKLYKNISSSNITITIPNISTNICMQERVITLIPNQYIELCCKSYIDKVVITYILQDESLV